jgi:hypothetical protein
MNQKVNLETFVRTHLRELIFFIFTISMLHSHYFRVACAFTILYRLVSI